MPAEPPPSGPVVDLWEIVDRELSASRVEAGLPGLSVAISRGGEVVFARGYGWANVEREVPVTPETMFPIASIEKEFTAAAVMRLVEHGLLSLDDPVTLYLPELDTAGETITIRQMLNQVSGLQETDTALAWRMRRGGAASPTGNVAAPQASDIPVGAGFSPGDEVALFGGVPLYHAPGARWTYSQPNYDLMCLVIARLTGRSYYEAIDDLARTAGIPFHAEWTPPPPLDDPTTAMGYERTADGPSPFHEENTGSGWTTASGLVRWSDALAAGRIVTAESYTRMTASVRLADGRTWHYGLGLVLAEFEGHRTIEHTGNISGFTSVLTRYPDDDLAIAVIANLGYTTEVTSIKQRISRLLLDLPEPNWADLVVPADERARYPGIYDAGGFWFVITDDGERLDFAMRDPGIDNPATVYFRTPLLYQGDGHFVGASAPDAIQVWFDLPGAPRGQIAASVAGSGWRPLADRLPDAAHGFD